MHANQPSQTKRDADVSTPARERAAPHRTVHAVLFDSTHVVRYDRAGKWYLERDCERRQVSFDLAVGHALRPGAQIRLGLPGGKRFDAAVRKLRDA